MDYSKKSLWIFLATSYGLFWGIAIIVLSLIGFRILNISLEGDSVFLNIIKILFSWTPTMAVLIHSKRLFPDTTLKNFLKNLFAESVNGKIVFLIITVQVILNVFAGLYVAAYDRASFIEQWSFSLPVIVNAAVMSLLTGACGEECGWRGYLLPRLMKKRGCIPSCILVGLIWGFWHLPLWLISGYTGIGLVLYCIEFMVCVIDWSIIMGILYCWNRNLMIPMLFHFMVNFMLCFFTGNDLLYQITLSVLYTITTVILCIVYTRKKHLSTQRIM